MSLARKEIFEFGEFRLDVNEHTIERLDGARNGTLTEKAFQALVLLVRRRGHLVTKDELIQFIWPDTIVEDNNLEKCIHHLRHFLGEAPDKSGYIDTVRKHGYRFVGDVRVVEVSGTWLPLTFRTDNGKYGSADSKLDQRTVQQTESDEIDGTRSPSLPVGKARYRGKNVALNTEELVTNNTAEAVAVSTARAVAREGSAKSSDVGRFRTWVGAAGIAVVLLGGVALYLTLSGGVLGKGEKSRIAVLPLKPLDLQGGDYLYDSGITEELISKLAVDKRLLISRWEAVRGYLDVRTDPVEAGKEQNVDYVLSAHYQIAGGKIKVTARLIEVATGEIKDNYTATRDSADVFAAQNAIANDIGNRVLARFGSSGSEFRSRLGTDNHDAYRHYQLAMNFIEQRSHPFALEHIERAVALDPNFARAWAAKAYIHRYVGSASEQSAKGGQLQKSMEAVNKALAIDPNLSEAYGALCGSKNSYGYWAAGPEAVCKRALELDPDSPLAHKNYSSFLYTSGRFDESIAEIKRAMELQPVSYDNQQVYALALYFARRFPESEAEWRRLIPLNPDHALIYGYVANCLEQQHGKESEAFEYRIKEMVLRKEVDNEKIERLRAVFETSGQNGITKERIKIAEEKADPDPVVLVRLYALLGDKDKAFEYLEKARWRPLLQFDPQLDPLRDDSRYADLVRRFEEK